jgi:hypothetical protein
MQLAVQRVIQKPRFDIEALAGVEVDVRDTEGTWEFGLRPDGRPSP